MASVGFALHWHAFDAVTFYKGQINNSKSKSFLFCSGVHTLLDDLLDENVYFRFNPILRAEVSLDESRPEVMDQLKSDTLQYLDRNQHKIDLLCMVLGAERTLLSRSKDWISGRAWELKHRWV